MPTDTQTETISELSEALRAFREEMGSKAHVSISLSAGEYASLRVLCIAYPKGVVQDEQLAAQGDTWMAAIEAARAEWEKRSEARAENTTKALALAIIRLTAEHGSCTDAALRPEFDMNDIARFGEAAVSMANDMSRLAPFAIVTAAGSNVEAA